MSRRLVRATLALACAAFGVVVPASAVAASTQAVVVTSPAGAAAAAEAVTLAGGRVVASLPLAGGVAAELPSDATLPAGFVVAADRTIRVAGLSAGTTGASTVRETLGMDPSGSEGAGVTVAVVDTGVADVPDLQGVVAEHVDVTGSGGGDPYGHGTFMAGLIAGTGASSGGRYTGVAPGARLVDVKVADAAGETSLSTVLRGLEAVAARPSVRVVNLSLSSGSPLPYQLDPLTRALESLWRRGVTVVVPAGNDGPDARTIGSPGVDPMLLTVSAVDENGTSARGDDTVPEWSSRGPAPQRVAKPDLAAPGAHLVSLRAPGSAVDVANEGSRVEDAYFRGSGTSMATAVASGAAAALLARRGGLTPDQVKAVFMGSAYSASGLTDRYAAGAGGLDVAAAYRETVRGGRRTGSGEEWAFAEFARAWAEGDYDAAARAWAALSPAARAWAARAWADAVWERASSWSGSEWEARAWAARAWAASSWTSEAWLARAWAARAWADADWAARAWAARAWAARAWSARAWAGRAWADEDWAGRAWADDDWAARAWAGRAWAGRAWAGRAWAGRAWADEEWEGRAWAGRAWAGRAWADDSWDGRAWAGRAWADDSWDGRAWAGRAWADDSWDGRAWAGRAWSAEGWDGSSWAGRAWAGSSWSARSWASVDWATS